MHKTKRKSRTAKIPKPIKVKKEKIDEERTPQSMAYHMDDRLELVKQIFGTLKPKTIINLAPDFLKTKGLDEIEEACLNELLCVSSKRLKSIITATKCPTDTESSDTNSDVERDEELISLEEISSGSEIEGNSSKKGEDGQISVLELLELQARARAIRSQLALEPVTKIEVDSDEDISKSGKSSKSVQESLTSCNELKRISSGQDSQKPLKQIKSNASAVEIYKTNIQLMNQTERRKKIKLKRNYRCTSAQELNAEKEETTEKIPNEEKEDKENEKRKDHNQENTTIFIKQEKNVRRSLSPDVIPIILEAETLLISDSSDADDEYIKNKNAENSFESKEEEVHKEIPKECDDTLSTPIKENVETDKNCIESSTTNNKKTEMKQK
uniref:Caspase activity and apoptosis inhibitor 1 n=1 Tax=Glossina morsitans morsitans TaxID=37546 RepID=A0ABK9MG02_GLOMM